MGRIDVLVIDDSAVVRQMLQAILLRESGISVTVAPNPVIARSKMAHTRPHVIVLDLEMPEMDGLTFLEQQMATDPIPVVVCSGLAGRGTEAALRAMEAGAVAVIEKPRLGVKGFLHESSEMLRETVVAAAGARVRRRAVPARPSPFAAPARSLRPQKPALRTTTEKVVALGASTGGTEALRVILEALPPTAPGLLVVQHMPEVFTRAFAQRLDSSCRIEVKEAADGDRVLEGRALIAPGNRHLLLRRSGGHYVVDLSDAPPVSRHRPSVDVLFHSVAVEAAGNAVGVILTGMGDDGARGLLEMKTAGAMTLAQDEESCVVFGMPKEAIARGAVDEVVPLEEMAKRLLRYADGLSGGRRPIRRSGPAS
ncbi:MAG TPA: chemotaxis response regulator protein-glutamate methylesterase [Vicinamibacteria bacterium]|nr:chemotaxis response regulator protein-glutamate methylesterase [Vicinamibacteria bacterium]